jgi:hypothetical protein
LLNAIKSKQVQLEPDSEQANLADYYFEETGKKIFQKTRFSFPQKNLLGFALQSEDSATSGSFSQLEEGIHYFKNKYVRKNIDKLLSAMAKKMILFICASPKDTNPIDFGDEYMKIKQALRASTDRDNYDVEVEMSVKKDAFLDLLNQYRPDYLHLSMHSHLTDGLYFEDENREIFPMPVKEFSDKIKAFNEEYKKPLVIILSACNSKAHAESVKGYCNFAIGTQAPFPAEAGIIYASSFYKTLLEGSDIPYCHNTAKLAIQYGKQQFDAINNIQVYDILVLIN